MKLSIPHTFVATVVLMVRILIVLISNNNLFNLSQVYRKASMSRICRTQEKAASLKRNICYQIYKIAVTNISLLT
jgi:hypothetical protein